MIHLFSDLCSSAFLVFFLSSTCTFRCYLSLLVFEFSQLSVLHNQRKNFLDCPVCISLTTSRLCNKNLVFKFKNVQLQPTS